MQFINKPGHTVNNSGIIIAQIRYADLTKDFYFIRVILHRVNSFSLGIFDHLLCNSYLT